MKNKILRVVWALVLTTTVALSFVSCGKAAKEQFPQPTEKFFTNDFAAVLSTEDADTIFTKGAALQEATTAQVIVVTINNLEDKPIEDYALEIGREWGVGDKEKNNGVVILFSKEDREIYVAVGYGLEGALPDSKTGRIIDTYGMAYFANDNFSAGLLGIYNALVDEVYIEYGMQPSENYVPVELLPDSKGESASAGKVIISWIVLIVLVLIYTSVFGRRGGLFIFGSPRFFGGSHHHGSFGGFGGGSSGGFGGFGGGGGSFGGGGAGRKF